MAVYLSRITLGCVNRVSTRSFSLSSISVSKIPIAKNFVLSENTDLFCIARSTTVKSYTTETAKHQKNLLKSELPQKKGIYKKPAVEELANKEGHFLTFAFVTANFYDLKGLKKGLKQQKLYEPGTLKASVVGDVVVANAVYSVGDEPREIMFFKEGAVVFWNCSELEISNVLDFVKPYEVESHPRLVVEKEREVMSYVYQTNSKKCHLQDSGFVLVPGRDNSLERYTFSHAMAQSARLGAWEARLEALAAAVRAHCAALERTAATHIDQNAVVRKLGELFSLRHQLNVESDLLDTPDFYWEEEELERLYTSTVAHFSIPRRTRVLNERLSHCVELLGLLSTWASDRHHVRLEWMIIVLIMVEVCFELLHFFERYIARTTPDSEAVV